MSNFLTARWEYLAMFNYTVDAAILQPHLPPFTEVDSYRGKVLVSVVGFLFNETRVLGIAWPGFTHFEEVNLRYYVRYKDGDVWKRGVGFISEIVPNPVVSFLANSIYNEHYSTAQMEHSIQTTGEELTVAYGWKKPWQEWNRMQVVAESGHVPIEPGSEAEFILEHYYGYNRLHEGATIEYGVVHPRWEIFPVKAYQLDCNVALLYGKEFVPYIQGITPHSVFLAKGSEVSVKMPVKRKR